MLIETSEFGSRMSGFPFWPMHDFVVVVDYGQPDKSPGGVFLGDGDDFGIYQFSMWRYGEVVAMGPGRLDKKGIRRPPVEGVNVGDKLAFSRKHGSRLPGSMRFDHPDYKRPLLMRVLDSDKCVMVMDPSFKPWWDVEDRQLDPSVTMSG